MLARFTTRAIVFFAMTCVAHAQYASIDRPASELSLVAADLPHAFARLPIMAEAPEGTHIVRFLRSGVKSFADLPEGQVFMVNLDVTVHDGVEAARTGFDRSVAADPEDIPRELAEMGVPSPRIVEVAPPDIKGADQAVAYLVVFRLEGLPVVETRYRLRVLNVLANLTLLTRAPKGGAETPQPSAEGPGVVQTLVERIYNRR